MAMQKKTGQAKGCSTAGLNAVSAGKMKKNAEPNQKFMQNPDANVAPDGHCLVPDFAETARFDTGEACLDGLNWPEAGDDVSVSATGVGLKRKRNK